ncbi:MAG: hypothetical protein M3072_16995 [Candidatus Dormibacteraeota bacterium]|nr:hypothetical protein [Candidatus Dormibacteraeota bacterium]
MEPTDQRLGSRPQLEGTHSAEAPPVLIGADIDTAALVNEIKADVQRRAEQGLYPPDLLTELRASSDPVLAAALDVRDASGFSTVVPVTRPVRASLRYVAPSVVLFKRLTTKALGWYTRWMVEQTHHFATASAAATSAIAERLARHDEALARSRERQEALERRVEGLEARLADLEPGRRPDRL